MKKLFYPFLFFAAMAMTTSCSQDEELVQQSGEMTTFKVELDGAAKSRTAGDGQTVNELYYAVYDKNGDNVIYPADAKYGKTTVTAGKATVSLPLMKSEAYDIVFWAQNKDANAYTFTELTEITVNYTGLKSNQENRDAFFNTLNDYIAKGNTQTVELRRPFAQLNVATSIEDWKNATYLYQANGNDGYPVKSSSVTIDNLATTFNAKTGAATGETSAEVVFDKNDILDESIWIKSIDNNGNEVKSEYKLLAMNYVLMESDKLPQDTKDHEKAEGDNSRATVEVDFTLWKDDANAIVSANVPFAPIQRNYRTNIIGNFLTGDATQFNIVVDANFDNDDNNVESGIIFEDDKKLARIYSVDGLKYFRDLVNGEKSRATTGETFSGWTIFLEANLDLNNEPWTPIGLDADKQNKFMGTFDGKGYTISNLKVETETGYTAAGFFGALNGTAKNFTIEGATIKHITTGNTSNQTTNGIAVVAGSIYNKGNIENVTVKNATVEGNRYVGGISGYVYGNIKDCTVDGITLTATPDNESGSYDNGDKVGGIAGYWACENTYFISGNAVKNASIKGYRDLGGIIGSGIGGAKNVTNNTVSNTTIVTDQETNSYGAKDYNVGAIIGRTNGSETIDESNVATDVFVAEKVISTADDLRAAIKDTKIKTVALADGEYKGLFEISKNFTIWGLNAGKAKINGMVFANNEATLTLKNLSLTNDDNTLIDKDKRGKNGSVLCEYQASIIAENCTFDAVYDYIVYIKSSDTNNYHKFINCTFKCNGKRAIHSKTNITVDNCTFVDQYRYSLQLRGQGDVTTDTKVVFTNNTVIDACKTSGKSYGTFIEISANQQFKHVHFEVDNNTGNWGFTYDDTNAYSATYLSSENFATCYFDGINFLPESLMFLGDTEAGDPVTVQLVEDLNVTSGQTIHTQNATGDITINGNGNTIVSTAESADDFTWEGNIPAMSTIFSSEDGSKVTVNDLKFSGTMSALMLGHYVDSKSDWYNTVLNNVDVIDTKVVSFSSNISPAVCVYGKATLNNCNIYGTTLSELDTDPMYPVYDVAVVNDAVLTLNQCKIGTIYSWAKARINVEAGTEVESIYPYYKSMNTNTKYGIVIKAGATVNVLNLSAIDANKKINITIEDGAIVNKVIGANGVEYSTLDEYINAH